MEISLPDIAIIPDSVADRKEKIYGNVERLLGSAAMSPLFKPDLCKSTNVISVRCGISVSSTYDYMYWRRR